MGAALTSEKLVFRRGTLLAGALLLVCLVALVAINIFPAMTNDSDVYLRYSRELASRGFVFSGIRQVGYPAILALVREGVGLVGAEPLLSTAVLQRALLVIGGFWAWKEWRWWGLGLIAFLIAGETVAYTNFILTEGLALGVALLLALSLHRLLEIITVDQVDLSRRVLIWTGLVGGLASILVLLRFTYIVFTLVLLGAALAAWRSRYRGKVLPVLAVFLVLIGSFYALVSLENREQFGVLTPAANSGPTDYYYGWVQVFALNPENRDNPELARYYDDGDVYDFGASVPTSGLSYEERMGLYEQEVESMFRDAGISLTGSRASSALWALLGGRIHDIQTPVQAVVSSTRANVEEAMYRNSLAANEGPRAFADQLNDSMLPRAVITDPLGVPPPFPDARHMLKLLLPASIAVMAMGIWRRHALWHSLIGLAVLISTAVGLGLVRADNFRLLIPASVFAMTLATGVLSEHVRRWSLSRQPISSRLGD